MQRIKMGKLSELAAGKTLEKRILARRIAVFISDGEVFGIEADCKHMKASLASGAVQDGILTCSWHGWQYDLRTGECLTRPGTKLKRYSVEVTGEEVFVII
jgi:nitrite reductase/ring-hydroxylating ferredoxin subunit